jgi:hypothetical protein
MSRRFINYRQTFIVCASTRSVSTDTRRRTAGTLLPLGYRAYTPELKCGCGHGKKAHAKGKCKEFYVCGCVGLGEEAA